MTKPMAIKTEYLIQPADVFPVACFGAAARKGLLKHWGRSSTIKKGPIAWEPREFACHLNDAELPDRVAWLADFTDN